MRCDDPRETLLFLHVTIIIANIYVRRARIKWRKVIQSALIPARLPLAVALCCSDKAGHYAPAGFAMQALLWQAQMASLASQGSATMLRGLPAGCFMILRAEFCRQPNCPGLRPISGTAEYRTHCSASGPPQYQRRRHSYLLYDSQYRPTRRFQGRR